MEDGKTSFIPSYALSIVKANVNEQYVLMKQQMEANVAESQRTKRKLKMYIASKFNSCHRKSTYKKKIKNKCVFNKRSFPSMYDTPYSKISLG